MERLAKTLAVAVVFASTVFAQQPVADTPLTWKQAVEDLNQLVEAVRYAWSYEEDKRLNFGVDLDALHSRAVADLEDELTRERFALILRRFVAGMQDGHAWAHAPPERREEALESATAMTRQTFAALAEVEAIILDLRHNGGGTDLLAMKVSDHLLAPGYRVFHPSVP